MESNINDRLIIAKIHLRRAEESLGSAKELYKLGYYNDSVSRSYYAAYHACYSIIYYSGLEPKTHKGVQNLLFIHFVETNLIERDLLKRFSALMQERGNADYGSISLVDKELAEKSVQDASVIVTRIINLLEELSSK